MKDSEFYTVSEDWPQPPDEACTLQEARVTASAAKPKKKKSGRVRKKMSESLAGVTAAAVAVVMVAASLPGLKDAFGDLPDFGLYTGICYHCGGYNCPYSYEGEPAQCLSHSAEPTYLTYDLYQMNGFTENDRARWENYHNIQTESGQRLILMLEPETFSGYYGGVWSSIQVNVYGQREGEPSATGVSYELRDDKTGENAGTIYLYLAYSPDGDFSELDIGEDVTDLTLHTFPADGVENAQIHVYSDMEEDLINQIQESCHVEVLQEQMVRYPLGDTMYLQENEQVYRTHDDEYTTRVHYYMGAEESEYLYWHFISDFCIKRYGVHQAQISFAATSWVDIFDQYILLNTDAAQTGHIVCFPLLELGETEVNGITYRCYAVYQNDARERTSVTFLCVPQQESEIAVHFDDVLSEEAMTLLLNGQIDETIKDQMSEILSQITLR